MTLNFSENVDIPHILWTYFFLQTVFFAQHSHHSFVTLLHIQKHNVHDSSFFGKNTTTKRLQHTMQDMFNLCDTCKHSTVGNSTLLAQLDTQINGTVHFLQKFNLITCPLHRVREATLSVICFCFAATKFILPWLEVVRLTSSSQNKTRTVFNNRGAVKLTVQIYM